MLDNNLEIFDEYYHKFTAVKPLNDTTTEVVIWRYFSLCENQDYSLLDIEQIENHLYEKYLQVIKENLEKYNSFNRTKTTHRKTLIRKILAYYVANKHEELNYIFFGKMINDSTNLNNEVQNLRTEFHNLKNNFKNPSYLYELKEKIYEIPIQFQSIKNSLSHLKKIAQLEQQIVKENSAALKTKLASYRHAYKNRNNDYKELVMTYQNQQQKLDSVNQWVEALETEKVDLKKQNQELQALLVNKENDSTKEISHLKEEKEKIQKQLNSIQNKAKKQRARTSSYTKSLKEKLLNLQEKYDSLENTFNTKKSLMQCLKNENDFLKISMNTLNRYFTQLKNICYNFFHSKNIYSNNDISFNNWNEQHHTIEEINAIENTFNTLSPTPVSINKQTSIYLKIGQIYNQAFEKVENMSYKLFFEKVGKYIKKYQTLFTTEEILLENEEKSINAQEIKIGKLLITKYKNIFLQSNETKSLLPNFFNKEIQYDEKFYDLQNKINHDLYSPLIGNNSAEKTHSFKLIRPD